MKISVIGAGALGTFYAAMMSASGQDVTLVCRERDVRVLRQGVTVTGAMDVAARPEISPKPVPSDVVFVTVKTYDIAAAAESLPLKPDTIVVIVHNGLIGEAATARALGPGHAAIGLCYGGVTFVEPGKVVVAGYTETIMGSLDKHARDRLGLPLRALAGAGLKARLTDDIRAAQWQKLFANVGINATTALTGLPNGGLTEVPELKTLVAAAVTEAAVVAAREGIRVEKDPVASTFRVIRETAGNRSSTLQDVSRGRRTEIDALNGMIGELGRKHGVPTPVNDTLTALVKGIEKRGGHRT